MSDSCALTLPSQAQALHICVTGPEGPRCQLGMLGHARLPKGGKHPLHGALCLGKSDILE